MKKANKSKLKFTLMPEFRNSLKYLIESRNYIFFIISVFIISSIIGFVFFDKLHYFDKILAELISKTYGLDTLDTIWFIFQNNLTASFIGLALGVFLGIAPIFNALSNGLILGYVMKISFDVAGAGVFLRLVPHGIFELPAIFISLGLGVRLGFFIFSRDWKKALRERAYNSLMVFVLIVVPLLVIAAFIEGFLISLIR